MNTTKKDLKKGDTVKLTPTGPPGTIVRILPHQAGEPPLAAVAWSLSGKTANHDRRDLILVEDAP